MKAAFKVYGMLVALLFTLTVSITAQEAPRSYYVSAAGDDQNNNGRSEEAPFKTLAKAVARSSEGTIKTIIILGTLTYETENNYRGDSAFEIRNSGNAEILIKGKDNATDEERAVLTAAGRNQYSNRVLQITGISKIRLENIEITGGSESNHYNIGNAQGALHIGDHSVGGEEVSLGTGVRIINNQMNGVCVYMSTLTITDGVEIKNNRNEGIYIEAPGKVIMTGGSITENGNGVEVDIGKTSFTMSGNSIISNNAGYGVSIGSTFIMQDNAQIQNNLGGGLIFGGSVDAATATISGNATILNNRSNRNGGAIYIRSKGTVILKDNVKITKNTAQYGGGIYIDSGGSLQLSANVDISENTAELVGGGIYVKTGGKLVGNGKINDNSADEGGQNIFKQE